MWCSIVGMMIALTLSMLAVPQAAHAQPVGKIPRLGVLAPGTPPQPAVEALRQGLRDLGYVEGQTIALEIRWDEGQPERSPDHAAALVARHVDLMHGHGHRRRHGSRPAHHRHPSHCHGAAP